MSNIFVAVAYDDEYQAREVRLRLLRMQKEYLIDLEDAVVAVRDAKGKVKLHQIRDLTAAGASYTGLPITIDGNIITGEALGAAIPFALALARTLAGADAANKVKTAIVYQ